MSLSHALNLAFFTALAESGELVPRLQRMSSTTFDAQLKVSTLVARDNPHLYFDIQTLNDYGAASLQALRAATERIERLVQSRDAAAFVELMPAARRYREPRTGTDRPGRSSGQGRPRPRAYAAAPPLGGADRRSSEERRRVAACPGA